MATVSRSAKIKSNELGPYLKMSVDTGIPLMLLGEPGVGKSASIKHWAANNGYALVDVRAAQMDQPDFGGFPVPRQIQNPTGEGTIEVTQPSRPQIITRLWDAHLSTGKPVMLFFDEVTAASMPNQSAMLEYVLDKTGGGFEMPEGTAIILAGNRPEDGAGIRTINKALVNRCSVMQMEPPTGVEWVRTMTSVGEPPHPIIAAYMENSPNNIVGEPSKDWVGVRATPRTWSAVSNICYTAEAYSGEGGTSKFNLSPFVAMISGLVGAEAAAEIVNLQKIYKGLVSVAEILKDPAKAPLPHYEDGVGIREQYMQQLLIVRQVYWFHTLNGKANGLTELQMEQAKARALVAGDDYIRRMAGSSDDQMSTQYLAQLIDLSKNNTEGSPKFGSSSIIHARSIIGDTTPQERILQANAAAKALSEFNTQRRNIQV